MREREREAGHSEQDGRMDGWREEMGGGGGDEGKCVGLCHGPFSCCLLLNVKTEGWIIIDCRSENLTVVFLHQAVVSLPAPSLFTPTSAPHGKLQLPPSLQRELQFKFKILRRYT